MGLPFTAEQFFGVFADYNRTFIVAVVALWVASLLMLAHVSRDPSYCFLPKDSGPGGV